MSFVLEVDNWGDWYQEREFSSMELAKDYALENYPHNQWRVIDKLNGLVEHFCSINQAMETVAAQEINRLQNTEYWRIFNQINESRIEMQRLNRLREVANRQRREQSRRERLRGFGFVGPRPEVARNVGASLHKYSSKTTTINWKKEGF